MIAGRVKALRAGWQVIALVLCLAGVGLLGYRLLIARPQGIQVGADLISAIPPCEKGGSDSRHHYRAANFNLYYYSSGCARLPGGIAIGALDAIGTYDKNLAAFGLPHLQADTAAVLVPGTAWRVLGTPGVGRGIVIGVDRRRDGDTIEGYEVGRPLAAAMLSEAAPGLPKPAREDLAVALADAAGPSPSRGAAVEGRADTYARMIVSGSWPQLRGAIDSCRSGCDFDKALDGALRRAHKPPIAVLQKML